MNTQNELPTIYNYNKIDNRRSQLIADYIYQKGLTPFPLRGISKKAYGKFNEFASRSECMQYCLNCVHNGVKNDDNTPNRGFFNIGVLCGDDKIDNRIVVIDVDIKGALNESKLTSLFNGLDLWDEFLRKNSPIEDKNKPTEKCTTDYIVNKYNSLFDTYTVKTGSGGLHYYFNVTKEFKAGTALYNCFDLKIGNGYVVSPYSIHPEYGTMYEPVDDDKPIRDMPDWLIKAINFIQCGNEEGDKVRKTRPVNKKVINSTFKPKLETIRKLVNILDLKYSTNRDLWIKLVFALKSTADKYPELSNDLLDILIEFTGKTQHKNRTPDKIPDIWDKVEVRDPADNESITIGSLYSWAKESDLDGYMGIVRDNTYNYYASVLIDTQVTKREHEKALYNTFCRSKNNNSEGHNLKYFYYEKAKSFYKLNYKTQAWEPISECILNTKITDFMLKKIDMRIKYLVKKIDDLEEELKKAKSDKQKDEIQGMIDKLKMGLASLSGLRFKVGGYEYVRTLCKFLAADCTREPSFSMFHRHIGSPTKFNLCKGFKANLVDFDFGDNFDDFIREKKHLGLYRFLHHIWLIAANQNMDHFKYIMACLTAPITNLRKVGIALIFSGIQGCGKTRITDFLCDHVYGLDSSTVVQDKNAVFGDMAFNASLSGKLFVVIPEVKRDGIGKDVIDQIKPTVTDNLIRIRGMYKEAVYENNNLSMIICTNSMMPLKLDDEQRRFAPFEFANPFEDKQVKYDYFKTFSQLSFNDETGDLFYSMALSKCFQDWLGDIDVRQIPQTDLLVSIIDNSKESHAVFFDEIFIDGTYAIPSEYVSKKRDGTYCVGVKNFLELYKSWCSKNASKDNIASTVFGSYIRSRGSKFLVPSKTNTRINGLSVKSYDINPKYADNIIISNPFKLGEITHTKLTEYFK